MFKIFFDNFIEKEYWKLLIIGIRNTLFVSTIALLFGFFIAIFLTLMQNVSFSKKYKFMEKIFYSISKTYVEFIRGTPILVQLTFFWVVVFGSVDLPKLIVGGIVFGISSGAWMTETMRSGIRSIDKGQMEAGLSLGFSKMQTFRYIIIPQALKNMLPSFISEYIALIKDTSLLSTIGGIDITRAGDIMIANTGNAVYPLMIIACTYLILTTFFSFLAKRFENNLKKNENRI